jgi:hypothetical protein
MVLARVDDPVHIRKPVVPGLLHVHRWRQRRSYPGSQQPHQVGVLACR